MYAFSLDAPLILWRIGFPSSPRRASWKEGMRWGQVSGTQRRSYNILLSNNRILRARHNLHLVIEAVNSGILLIRVL